MVWFVLGLAAKGFIRRKKFTLTFEDYQGHFSKSILKEFEPNHYQSHINMSEGMPGAGLTLEL